MHNIRYSNEAQTDIAEAIEYIVNESKTNAKNYLSRYEDKIELLRLNPYMGVDCNNKLIKRDCRVLVHESHIIIYQIIESRKEIYLIRIFHASVNYPVKTTNKKNK